MSYHIKERRQDGQVIEYRAIGDREAIENAAYDGGAMGLTVIVAAE